MRAPNQLPRFYADSEPVEPTETLFAAPSLPSIRETLTVLAGMEAHRVYALEANAVWIGRDQDCTICLRDRGVSRRHASIAFVPGGVVLRDNGAKNGTYVNGKRIEEHALTPGDEIQLGPNVSLLFSHASGAVERIAQQQAAREQLLTKQMYAERIESLAGMVTGLAHEINTPLGVANTANALIASLVEEVRLTPAGPALDAILAELKDSTDLMGRNIARASHLVRSFKQLSARQLSDDYVDCDLVGIIQDCFSAMSGDLKRRKITVTTGWAEGAAFPWAGYPGHLSQVLMGLIQNTLCYAYRDDEEGSISVDIKEVVSGYRLEFRDAGAGVPPEIYPRIFEPFVTSGRESGATGLGLAITYNIVSHILDGEISCSSKPGNGTTFVITIPRTCPEERSTHGHSSFSQAAPAG